MSQAVLTRPTVRHHPPVPEDFQSHRIQSRGILSYRGVPIEAGKTAFILPCHNEAADLEDALTSIKNQVDATVHTILVVSDNSTDDTVAIARAAGVSVIETSGNRFKKAGALNQGIRYLMESGALPEFIITGDGDTVYDEHFVSRALQVMRADPRLGVLSAVCYGKTGLTPGSGRPPRRKAKHARRSWSTIPQLLSFFSLMGRRVSETVGHVLLWMQRAEYTRAATLRLRHNIHTMSGAGSMIRSKAAIDVLYADTPPGEKLDWSKVTLYKEHQANLVEDFALTLDIKAAGWRCTNNLFVIARTDLMRDFSSLFRQRVRWVRGTIDELRRRKFSRESRVSALTIIYGLALIPLYYVLNALILTLIFSGPITLVDFWLFPFMGAYQAILVRKMGWKSMLIAFILVPEMLYAAMRHAWIIVSLGKSLLSATQRWE